MENHQIKHLKHYNFILEYATWILWFFIALDLFIIMIIVFKMAIDVHTIRQDQHDTKEITRIIQNSLISNARED